MMVIPKENPVHRNLSSYYVDVEKFLEHSKKELGSGCVVVNSSGIKGVVFFDTDEILNAVCTGHGDGEQTGKEALDILLQTTAEQTSELTLYKIDENMVYNWAKLGEAAPIDGEVTEGDISLEEYIKRMSPLKLTGYVEVRLNGDQAILLFQDGQFTGGSFSWGDASMETDQKNLGILIKKSAEANGVYKAFGTTTSPEKLFDASHNNEKNVEKASSSVIATLEELLDIFERVVHADADVDVEFDMLLRNKFVEKANVYTFLDPFANEFQYANQKITFTGKATERELALGITECVRELADELGILRILKHEIANWSTYLGRDIAEISDRFL